MRRTRIGAVDLADEALFGLLARPGRSVLTALGTVLAVGTLVAVLGLTATAAGQVGERFDLLKATQVTVADARGPGADPSAPAFPEDADTRAARLNGVEAAGVRWTVPTAGHVAATPRRTDRGIDVPVVAVTPGLFAAAGAHVAVGRTFDGYAQDRRAAVAVLGSAVAVRLGIASLDAHPAVFLGGSALTVIGIVDDATRAPELALSVLVPASTATALWGAPAVGQDGATMLVATAPGAATQVAGEVALAVRPDEPAALAAVPPPDPHELREAIDTDLQSLFLVLAGVCLVIGAVGIANTTLVAVMERVPEIGLRRAVGARGIHVAGQFLTESGALGLLGGILGTCAGLVVVAAVALSRQWTPVLPTAVMLAAPGIGLATGLLAGVYPALRAAAIEPAEALRR